MAEIVKSVVVSASSEWEGLIATIQSKSTQYFDAGVATAEFLRFVVIDLALRVSVASRLAGRTESRLHANLGPRKRLGKMLRQLAQGAGITRDQFAACAEVSYATMANWFDGKNRPSHRYVGNLAKSVTSSKSESDTQRVERAI